MKEIPQRKEPIPWSVFVDELNRFARESGMRPTFPEGGPVMRGDQAAVESLVDEIIKRHQSFSLSQLYTLIAYMHDLSTDEKFGGGYNSLLSTNEKMQELRRIVLRKLQVEPTPQTPNDIFIFMNLAVRMWGVPRWDDFLAQQASAGVLPKNYSEVGQESSVNAMLVPVVKKELEKMS